MPSPGTVSRRLDVGASLRTRPPAAPWLGLFIGGGCLAWAAIRLGRFPGAAVGDQPLNLALAFVGAAAMGVSVGWMLARRGGVLAPAHAAGAATAGRAPRIVCLGGGHGLATLLKGLKAHTERLTAIVTVADDGGSSGRLRQDYRVVPPGDIRNCLVALAANEDIVARMFQFRFQLPDGAQPGASGLEGHSLGNLLLTGLGAITGDFLQAIRVSGEVLGITGEVLPSTLAPVKLWAVMADGTVVEGESRIPEAGQRIREIHLSLDDAEPAPGVLERIAEADLIVLGPGSLFTSILPNLLVPRIRRAIAASRAPVLVVVNVMTQRGETDGFNVGDHLAVLRSMGGLERVDHVLVHDGLPSAEARHRYAASGAHPVELDRATIEDLGGRVLRADIAGSGDVFQHDPEKLAHAVMAALRAGG